MTNSWRQKMTTYYLSLGLTPTLEYAMLLLGFAALFFECQKFVVRKKGGKFKIYTTELCCTIQNTLICILTWITRMLRPVSLANCSRICRVGFGVWEKAVFRTSSCLALMVVRGPRRFPPAPSSTPPSKETVDLFIYFTSNKNIHLENGVFFW